MIFKLNYFEPDVFAFSKNAKYYTSIITKHSPKIFLHYVSCAADYSSDFAVSLQICFPKVFQNY